MRRSLLFCLAAAFTLACGDNVTEPISDPTTAVTPPPSFATTTTEDGLSISTDKDDYQPGDVVHLTGSGWEPGDVLDIVLTDDPLTHDPHTWSIQVDQDGTFHDTSYTVDEGDINVAFTLVATSRGTGRSLTVNFTDNVPSTSVTLDGVASVTVAPGATISLAVLARITSQNPAPTNWNSTGWVLLPSPASTQPAGKLANCVNTADVAGSGGTGTAATRTFDITAPTAAGTYDLWLAFSDVDGTGATACGGGGSSSKIRYQNRVTVQVADETAPTVTINQASGQADPTNTSPIDFTVEFSEAVTGFAASDLSFVGSTVGGTLSAAVTGGPSTYSVAVSGMSGSGTVVASISAGAASDGAGNSSAASTSTDNTVSFDGTTPGVTIDQASAQADPTNASPINYTVVFSKAVTGFAGGDVSFAGSTAGGSLNAAVTGGPSTYNVAVTGMTGDGVVIASIPAGKVTDAIGNANTASTSTDNSITYDATAPEISCGSADGNWHAADVEITCTASDALSGLANSADATFKLATSVAAGTETNNASTDSRTVADLAGNSATAGPISGNKVDKKAPAVSCGAADGAWHATDVSIPCSATDGGSGLTNSADGSFNLSTSVPAGTETANASTDSRSVADAVGNSTTAGPISGNKVDKKGPVVALTCPATPLLLNAPVTAAWNATDGGSGFAGSSSGTINVPTGSAGPKTVGAPAGIIQDAVGNPSTASNICSYRVRFNFLGLAAPVDRPSTLNVSKAGQAIPLKWQLTDYAGRPVTNLTAVSVQVKSLSCAAGTTPDQLEEYASGSSGLQNLGGGYYQFNWKTPVSYAGSCKTLGLDLGEGAIRANLANFTFKR